MLDFSTKDAKITDPFQSSHNDIGSLYPLLKTKDEVVSMSSSSHYSRHYQSISPSAWQQPLNIYLGQKGIMAGKIWNREPFTTKNLNKTPYINGFSGVVINIQYFLMSY